MANPNLVEQSTRYDKTLSVAATTSAVDILTNAAASGKVYRVIGIYACNTSTNTPTVTIGRKVNGATVFNIIQDIPIPVGSTLVPVARDILINLEENDSLTLTASLAEVAVHVSYEEIS
jgi:hypothetical protein